MSVKPPVLMLHRWIASIFKFTHDQIECIQFDHISHKFDMKLITKMLVEKTLSKFDDGIAKFCDEEGNEQDIHITEDGEDVKVRVYDFPIELSNSKIKDKLSEYGTVKNIINEKYSGHEELFAVENGI
ncbi:hypothetical protein HHI36_003102 [Cryptolaemus montrouzieri]|uniref:Uncharacterized protein n=1 Tax=Cryptolaemus montrouzieri TaxID=559131 RepID=A0ABD2PCY2_9CUCU